jgi:hypothetical protein
VVSHATRRSTDGRCPVDNVTEYFDVAVHQVRASSVGFQSLSSQSETPAPPALELDELTILTGWAQALAEAVAYAPDRVEDLLADALAVPWRAALRIAQPSQRLSEAICFIGQAARVLAPSGGAPTLAMRCTSGAGKIGGATMESTGWFGECFDQNSCSPSGTSPIMTKVLHWVGDEMEFVCIPIHASRQAGYMRCFD